MKLLLGTMSFALLAGVPASQAALTALASSSFTNQYNAGDILNSDPHPTATGSNNTVSPWSLAGMGGTATITLNTGSDPDAVHFTQTGQNTGNGWIQQDTGSSPFESFTGSWTLEIRARLGDATTGAARTLTNGFVVWTDLLGNNQIVTIDEDRVALYGTNNAGTELVSSTNLNADGNYHTFRIAYEHNATSPAASLFHIFRDGVDLTGGTGVLRRGSAATTRLIAGDCCSGAGGINAMDVDVEYVRMTSGAFRPVPEPAVSLLGGLGLLGLLRRRR